MQLFVIKNNFNIKIYDPTATACNNYYYYMSEYFYRIKVSVLYKYIQVKKLLSTLVLRKALK